MAARSADTIASVAKLVWRCIKDKKDIKAFASAGKNGTA
jgi:hypothetical protein